MKRFTETEKWRDPWFRKLIPTHKCLWQFLCDNCDHAGVWEPDAESIEFFVGEFISLEEALAAFDGRIDVLPSGKWRIVKFVQFQFGELNPDCKPHKPIFAAISRHGLDLESVVNGSKGIDRVSIGYAKGIDRVSKGYPKGIQRVSIGYPIPFERVQEKEKETDKETETEKDRPKPFIPPSPEEVSAYSQEIGYPLNGEAWCDTYAQKGWMVGKNKMKDWKAAVRTWKANSYAIASSAAPTPAVRLGANLT